MAEDSRQYTTHIERLKVLTDALPYLDELINVRQAKTISWQMLKGTCIGESLLDTEKVSVIKGTFSDGSEFPEHIHKVSTEILIVVDGILKTETPETSYITNPGEVIILKNGEPHKHTALTEVYAIGITIPRSIGYPTVDGELHGTLEYK